MGSSCHVGHDGPNSGCCIVKCKKLRKPSLTSPTENQPRRARKKNFGIFLSSRPEHNQKPPTDAANRHCAFIPTRRKIAVWPQGAQSTAPLARGRSCALLFRLVRRRQGAAPATQPACRTCSEDDLRTHARARRCHFYSFVEETSHPNGLSLINPLLV